MSDVTELKTEEYWKTPKEEKVEVSRRLKEEGNQLFKNKEYALAIARYQDALDTWKSDIGSSNEEKEESKHIKISCLLNTAACQLQLNEFQEAKSTCDEVLKLDGNNVKGLYRRGKALIAMGLIEEAFQDLKSANEIDSNNSDILKELSKLRQLLQEQEEKQKIQFKGLFDKGTIYDDLNTTTVSDSGNFLENFFMSMITPGITSDHIRYMNVIFVLLFMFALTVLISTAGTGVNIHYLVFFFLVCGLFVSVQWFILNYKAIENETEMKEKIQ